LSTAEGPSERVFFVVRFWAVDSAERLEAYAITADAPHFNSFKRVPGGARDAGISARGYTSQVTPFGESMIDRSVPPLVLTPAEQLAKQVALQQLFSGLKHCLNFRLTLEERRQILVSMVNVAEMLHESRAPLPRF